MEIKLSDEDMEVLAEKVFSKHRDRLDRAAMGNGIFAELEKYGRSAAEIYLSGHTFEGAASDALAKRLNAEEGKMLNAIVNNALMAMMKDEEGFQKFLREKMFEFARIQAKKFADSLSFQDGEDYDPMP